MRVVALVRNYALFVFFMLLVGGVVLQPGKQSDTASAPAATDGGVYQAS